MSKKRKSKAFIRRSKASKKGWATRRKNAAKAGITVIDLGKHRKHLAGLTVKQAKKKVAALKQGLKSKQFKKKSKRDKATIKYITELFESFVTDASPAEIRADGSIAHSMSRLRMLSANEKDKLWQEMQVKEGEEDFDLYMYDIADQYEVEVREVYTFFFSP